MPIFEYKCDKCGKLSEFLESAGSKKQRKCDHCGSTRMQKQFSVFAPRVKAGESKKCNGCTDLACPHAGN